MSNRAHYPSGEPGTTGREPFEEGRTSETGKYDGLSGQEGAGGGVVGEHGHGGTIARDTGIRDGEVVGLGGPKDSGFNSSSNQGLGGAGAGTGYGEGPESARNQNFGAEHSTTHGDSYGSRGQGVDRTGPLDQEAHKYERTGAGGPTTSGAAGTDRFDVDRDRSGATGNSYGASDNYPDYKEGEKDANRKGTGGIGGILGTSDKDFTANPKRTGDGAYTDTDGRYESNTSGPAGNTALTGREGTSERNPVAQAKSHEQGTHGTTGTTGTHGTTGAHGEHEKKGLMEKVKEVFH